MQAVPAHVQVDWRSSEAESVVEAEKKRGDVVAYAGTSADAVRSAKEMQMRLVAPGTMRQPRTLGAAA